MSDLILLLSMICSTQGAEPRKRRCMAFGRASVRYQRHCKAFPCKKLAGLEINIDFGRTARICYMATLSAEAWKEGAY